LNSSPSLLKPPAASVVVSEPSGVVGSKKKRKIQLKLKALIKGYVYLFQYNTVKNRT